MMILGHSGLSDDQKRVHMGMWCMFAAPLLITTDLENWDKVSASLFSNKYLIAIDQDKGGHLAEYITTRNDVQMWIRKLDECPVGWAIACVYTKIGGRSTNFRTSLDEFKSSTYTISGEKFELMDVFTGTTIRDVALTEKFEISINPTGISMIRVKPYTIEYSYV
ncbi:unnamed protein product [Schistosoma turkestanicum]|nr:unnamed protein product [Schistosoma turkestanicum]